MNTTWMNAAWITAITGLIGIFLTVPQIISEFILSDQAVKLAVIQREAELQKISDLKQDQEYKIVSNTLSQQGKERVFVLRYLAATLDDVEARSWAALEVDRLEKVNKQEEELKLIEEKIVSLTGILAELEISVKGSGVKRNELLMSISELEKVLERKKSEVDLGRQNAGLAVKSRSPVSVLVRVYFKEELSRPVKITFMNDLDMVLATSSCNNAICTIPLTRLPYRIKFNLKNGARVKELKVNALSPDRNSSIGALEMKQVYECGLELDSDLGDSLTCGLNPFASIAEAEARVQMGIEH